MEISSPFDFTFANTPSTNKDWFEFLLDLDLLDKHLNSECPGNHHSLHFIIRI